MNKALIVVCFIFGVVMMITAFPEGVGAALFVVFFSSAFIFILRRQYKEEADFIVQLFLSALLVRLAFGLSIHVFDLRLFFGGDSLLYDAIGNRLLEMWFGYSFPLNDELTYRIYNNPSGWGMYYTIGGLYIFTGRNILAAQSFCGAIGAATVPLVYSCAYKIFNNRRVGKMSALMVAFYPAFIIWSGQVLKDGLIIFLLVFAMLLVLRLQEKFNYFEALLLGGALFGIFSLRFYIFYIAALGIVGAFVIGTSDTPKVMLKRMVVLAVMGIALAYVGVTRNAESDIGEYANLERIQSSRQDLATSAESGYGEDLDVSTVGGAFTALPIGLAYLLLAPFPWEITNFRQLTTMPEVVVWWLSLPFLITGLSYTLKNRLRNSIPILVFTMMLTLAYSLFLGNVGTAYRQRTQIQVFFFIFIAVGWTIYKERKENAVEVQKSEKKAYRKKSKIK